MSLESPELCDAKITSQKQLKTTDLSSQDEYKTNRKLHTDIFRNSLRGRAVMILHTIIHHKI